MSVLRWMTAGESHGPALVGILAGLPAGLEVDIAKVNEMLARRRQGIGRSARQEIERDNAVILSGVRHGVTTGSPIAVTIENRDFANWRDVMSPDPPSAAGQAERIAMPRPGHADLAGALKWELTDARNVLERASGRTTAITTALGAICSRYLAEFGIFIGSRLLSFGPDIVASTDPHPPTRREIGDDVQGWITDFGRLSDETRLRIEGLVDEARSNGDTLGGSIQVVAAQIPPGLGCCALPDERLDSRLGAAVLGVPGIKAVEIGAGIEQSAMSGRDAHDGYAVVADESHQPWFGRFSNLAGGIEGGMTDGEPICLTAWMKPLSTVHPPAGSVDPATGKPIRPDLSERSDVAAVESAACVIESAVALELARAHLEKFSGDTMAEVAAAVRRYEESLKRGKSD